MLADRVNLCSISVPLSRINFLMSISAILAHASCEVEVVQVVEVGLKRRLERVRLGERSDGTCHFSCTAS